MNSSPKSRRSGGPKTAEGKLASSRNSLKTGTYSKQEVLPGENPQELLELEQYFIEDFAPQGVTESALVHDLTVLAWKKLRLERLEYRRLRDKLNEPLDYFEAEGIGLNIPPYAQMYFDDPSLITNLDLSIALEHLKFSKKLKTAKFILSTLEEIHEDSLSTFVTIKRKIEDLGATVNTAKSMVDCKYSDVSDDLDRFFFRTLSELRKQQEWRYRRDAIVMAQEVPPILEGKKFK